MLFEKDITKRGGSLLVTLPPDLLKYMDLAEKSKVVLIDKLDEGGVPYLILRKVIDDEPEV